jgi:hypothetical protein
LPWLSSAQTSAGVELQLVNISRTGFLAECSSKFEPNASVEVRLAGAQTSLLVPVRFVRSEVARVDALGVRYSLAAVFQKKLELLSDQSGSSAGPVTAGDVADLLAKATRASDSEPAAGSARTMFEHGLRSLIGARDVAIVDRLDSAAGGEDGVCFTIPCVDGTPAVLQVTFEAGQLPGRDEFALLRAAAAAAAVLLHHEASSHRRTTLAFDDAPSLRSSRAARLAPARSTTAKTSISDR